MLMVRIIEISNMRNILLNLLYRVTSKSYSKFLEYLMIVLAEPYS